MANNKIQIDVEIDAQKAEQKITELSKKLEQLGKAIVASDGSAELERQTKAAEKLVEQKYEKELAAELKLGRQKLKSHLDEMKQAENLAKANQKNVDAMEAAWAKFEKGGSSAINMQIKGIQSLNEAITGSQTGLAQFIQMVNATNAEKIADKTFNPEQFKADKLFDAAEAKKALDAQKEYNRQRLEAFKSYNDNTAEMLKKTALDDLTKTNPEQAMFALFGKTTTKQSIGRNRLADDTFNQALKDKAEEATKAATKAMRDFYYATSNARTIFGLFSDGIGSAVNLYKLGDTLINVENKIKSVATATESTITTFNKLYSTSNDSRSSLEATTQGYLRLRLATESLGVSQDRVIGISSTLNKALALSGATTQERNSALLQFAQGLGSGALQGDELRSLRENAPLVAKALADEFGVSIGQLKLLGSTGQITAERIISAMEKVAPAVNAQFADLRKTSEQQLQELSNSFTLLTGTLQKSPIVSGIFGGIVGGLTKINEALANSPALVTGAIGGLTALGLAFSGFLLKLAGQRLLMAGALAFINPPIAAAVFATTVAGVAFAAVSNAIDERASKDPLSDSFSPNKVRADYDKVVKNAKAARQAAIDKFGTEKGVVDKLLSGVNPNDEYFTDEVGRVGVRPAFNDPVLLRLYKADQELKLAKKQLADIRAKTLNPVAQKILDNPLEIESPSKELSKAGQDIVAPIAQRPETIKRLTEDIEKLKTLELKQGETEITRLNQIKAIKKKIKDLQKEDEDKPSKNSTEKSDISVSTLLAPTEKQIDANKALFDLDILTANEYLAKREELLDEQKALIKKNIKDKKEQDTATTSAQKSFTDEVDKELNKRRNALKSAANNSVSSTVASTLSGYQRTNLGIVQGSEDAAIEKYNKEAEKTRRAILDLTEKAKSGGFTDLIDKSGYGALEGDQRKAAIDKLSEEQKNNLKVINDEIQRNKQTLNVTIPLMIEQQKAFDKARIEISQLDTARQATVNAISSLDNKRSRGEISDYEYNAERKKIIAEESAKLAAIQAKVQDSIDKARATVGTVENQDLISASVYGVVTENGLVGGGGGGGIDAFEKLPETTGQLEEFTRKLADAQKQTDSLKVAATDLGIVFENSFSRGLSNGIFQVLNGTEKSIKDMMLRVLKGASEAALQASINALITGNEAKISGSSGGIFGSLIKLGLGYITGGVGYGSPRSQAIGNPLSGGLDASSTGGFSSMGLATGGFVTGKGTGTSDEIPAWLSNGEFVVKEKAVSKYGVQFFNAINEGRIKYANGGLVAPRAMKYADNATVSAGLGYNKSMPNIVINNISQTKSAEATVTPEFDGESLILNVVTKAANDPYSSLNKSIKASQGV